MTTEIKAKASASEQIAAAVLGLAAMCGVGFVRVWCLLTMWRWVFVPMGAPDVGYWWAYAVAVCIGALTFREKSDEEKRVAALAVEANPWRPLGVAFKAAAMSFGFLGVVALVRWAAL